MRGMKESLAVASSALAFGGAPAVANASPEAPQSDPQAVAASVFHWNNVGGAPLVEGGVDTLAEAEDFLQSPAGHKTLQKEGLNPYQVAAVEKAVDDGKLVNCTIPAGKVMKSMVSKNFSVEKNVKLTDPEYPNGVPGFCVTATRKWTTTNRKKHTTTTHTQKIRDAIAGPCTNGLAISITETSKTTHAKPKPKTVPISVRKIALDEHGFQLPETPTGTFRFRVSCLKGGKRLVKEVIYNQEKQTLANCDPGKGKKRNIVKVSELSTLGPDKWVSLTPDNQQQFVRKKGNHFVFKDKEAPLGSEVNPVCPTGTTWNDKNHDGKIQNDECEVPPVVPPAKNGTQTPQPPANAPGPNPAPSPQEPFPGGYACYDEATGFSVTPKDGLCPAGSYGQV